MVSAIVAIDARFAATGVEWAIGGSAARALAGFAVSPRDLDLEVPTGSAQAASTALGVPLTMQSGGGRSSRRGTTHIAGVEVDLSAGLVIDGLAPAALTEITTIVVVGRRAIRAVTPEEQLCRAIVAGDEGRAARLQREAPLEWSLDYAYLESRAASVRAE